MADPVNLDPIDVPDVDPGPQPAPQPAPQSAPQPAPQSVAGPADSPPVQQNPPIVNVGSPIATNIMVGVLFLAIIVLAIAVFKKRPEAEASASEKTASPPAAKEVVSEAPKAVKAEKVEAAPKEKKADEKVEAKATATAKPRAEVKLEALPYRAAELYAVEEAEKPLARETKARVYEVPEISAKELAESVRPIRKILVGPERISFPASPAIREDKSEERLSAKELAESVRPIRKILVGPERISFPASPAIREDKSEERLKEEALVRKMFDMNAPTAPRVASAIELRHYRYYRVARALSLVLQRDTIAQLRAAAADSMGDVANSTFLPILNNSATRDPDPAVRDAARKSAGKVQARVKAELDF